MKKFSHAQKLKELKNEEIDDESSFLSISFVQLILLFASQKNFSLSSVFFLLTFSTIS